MADVDTLETLLHELGDRIGGRVNADRVVDPEIPTEETGARPVTLSEQIEAFKALKDFYIALRKVDAKSPRKNDESVTTFGSMRSRIKAVEG